MKRSFLSSYAAVLGVVAASAAPAAAETVRVRFDLLQVANVTVSVDLGGVPIQLPLTVGGVTGSYLTFVFDTATNEGALIDSRLAVQGPYVIPNFATLTGSVVAHQIPSGTSYTYVDENFLLTPAVATDPRGTFAGNAFEFDVQELVHNEGPPGSGLNTCTGSGCGFLPLVLPLDLSGPQPPVDIGPPEVGLDIVDLVPGQTATLTGPFAFTFRGTRYAFEITDARGTVMAEPPPPAGPRVPALSPPGFALLAALLGWLGIRSASRPG